MATHSLLTVQEDDLGRLKMFAIDETSGAVSLLRDLRMSSVTFDTARFVAQAANFIASFDSDGSLTCYTKDGEEIFTRVAPTSSWYYVAFNSVLISGDTISYFLIPSMFAVQSDKILRHITINPITGSTTIVEVCDLTLFPEMAPGWGNWFDSGSNDDVVLVKASGEYYALINDWDTSGKIYTWKLTGVNTWTESTPLPFDSVGGVNTSALYRMPDKSVLEFVQGGAMGSANARKLVVNLTTATMSMADIVVDMFGGANPRYWSTQQYHWRESASTTLGLGGLNDATEVQVFDPPIGGRAAPTLGAAGSGPGGVGQALVMSATTQAVIPLPVYLSSAYGGTHYTLTVECYFDDVTTKAFIISAPSTDYGIGIENGVIKFFEDNGTTVLGATTLTVPQGQWVTLAFGIPAHAGAQENTVDKVTVAIGANVETVTLTAAHEWLIGAFGQPWNSGVPSFIGRIGGFVVGVNNGGNSTVSAIVSGKVVPPGTTYTPLSSIVRYYTYDPLACSNVGLRGHRLYDSSGTLTTQVLVSGETMPQLTGSYTMGDGITYDWINNQSTTSGFKAGPFFVYLQAYGLSVRNAGGTEVSQWTQLSTQDREMNQRNVSVIANGITTREISGTVKTAQNVNINDAQVTLLNNRGNQILSTAVSSGGVYSFICSTADPHLVLATVSDVDKNAVARAHIQPSIKNG